MRRPSVPRGSGAYRRALRRVAPSVPCPGCGAGRVTVTITFPVVMSCARCAGAFPAPPALLAAVEARRAADRDRAARLQRWAAEARQQELARELAGMTRAQRRAARDAQRVSGHASR